MMMPTYDFAVIGGGSGGVAAALAAARRGLRVLLVEAGPSLGGTATLAGVNTWEPGIGAPLAAELYALLARTPHAIGVSRTVKHWSAEQPWGLSCIDRALPYAATLRRAGLDAEHWFRVTYEPAAMGAAMAALLVDTERVDLRLGTRLVGAETEGRHVTALRLSSGGRETRVTARVVADATGQLHLCTAVGCRIALGEGGRAVYDEPSAPEVPQARLNGVTLCFRATPADSPAVEPLPPGVPDERRPGNISITTYPCGDLNFNVLPVMEGWAFHTLGETAGRQACETRVYQLWQWLQREHGFDRYRLAGIFPMVGVREGPRLAGRAVLTEHEVRGTRATDDWIARADHALDVHGEGHLCRELAQPYGIPYACLLPQEYDNLIVPCRGASFSHIAAASCRLTRTMMQLGHAAGLAAAEAVAAGCDLPDIDPVRVRAAQE
jgi:hypothetical protein